jgi:purine/pyrimidine-nucleoside phosphorylase
MSAQPTAPVLQAGRDSPTSPLSARPQPIAVTALKWIALFNNVSVVKKANVYFGGNVSSRTVKFADGSMKTLGFMLPGEYTFNTADKEIMEILDGDLEVLLPGSDQWQKIKSGESFNVPANAKFTVKINTPTDYCCSFIT